MAAIIVLLAVLMAFQSIVLTPTTAGTVDRDVKAHLATETQDTLRAAQYRGWLRNVTLYWNSEANNGTGGFNESASTNLHWNSETGYNEPPPGRFGTLLQKYIGNTHNYNIYVSYRLKTNPSTTTRVILVKQGAPTGNAVTASATITIYDTDRIRWWNNGAYTTSDRTPQVGALEGAGFYAPDLPGPIYNVVTVRVVVW